MAIMLLALSLLFTVQGEQPWHALEKSAVTMTSEEATLALVVRDRRSSYNNGEVARWISTGTYTIDSLASDMDRYWVQHMALNQGNAINSFVDLMAAAKSDPPKDTFIEAVKSILGGVASIVPVPGLNTVWSAFMAGVSLLEQQAINSPDTYLAAARSWRSSLSQTNLQNLYSTDQFLRPIRSDISLLLPAYDLVTDLVANLPSYRSAFNTYYSTFMQAQLHTFDFNIIFAVENDREGRFNGTQTQRFTPAPPGLNACTIANDLLSLNLGLVRYDTPGFGVPFYGFYRPFSEYGNAQFLPCSKNLTQVDKCLGIDGRHQEVGSSMECGPTPWFSRRGTPQSLLDGCAQGLISAKRYAACGAQPSTYNWYQRSCKFCN